jgi:hypothetical protein
MIGLNDARNSRKIHFLFCCIKNNTSETNKQKKKTKQKLKIDQVLAENNEKKNAQNQFKNNNYYLGVSR